MSMKHTLVFIALFLCAALQVHAADTPVTAKADLRLETAEGVVQELYRLICVPVGAKTDWEQVRNLFIPEAVIILRVSKTASNTFTVQGWIDDFIAYNEKAKSSERGFEEKIVRMSTTVFRDIAHILVLYEARMLDWSKPAAPGVDSIELIRRDGRWWIAAITNDLPNEAHPIPAALKD
jgi:hypothetical protein